MLKYKVILFDFWDTIARISNLEDLIVETKKTLGEKRYSKLMEYFIKWHTSDISQKVFIQKLREEMVINKHEMLIIKKFLVPECIENFPETKEVLGELKNKGIKLILISNAPPPSKNAFEKLHLTQFFEKTIFSCDVNVMKPNKEIFYFAIKDINIDPHEILMVGDSLMQDIEGAKNIGLDGVLVDRKGLSTYQNKISNLKELIIKVES